MKKASHAGIKSKLEENVSDFGGFWRSFLFVKAYRKNRGSKNNEISRYSQVYRDQISHTCLVNLYFERLHF